MKSKRIILAVTGASGMPYAAACARALSETPGVELHLILSDAAVTVLDLESDMAPEELTSLAHRSYAQRDLAAGPASGSWPHAGMIVCPCSMASLAAIANGLGSNLIHRAADVTLKESRPLVLVPREMPFNEIHLKNMLAAKRAGAVIMAPCPGFYHKPESLRDMVDFTAGRILDQLHIEHSLYAGWKSEE